MIAVVFDLAGHFRSIRIYPQTLQPVLAWFVRWINLQGFLIIANGFLPLTDFFVVIRAPEIIVRVVRLRVDHDSVISDRLMIALEIDEIVCPLLIGRDTPGRR